MASRPLPVERVQGHSRYRKGPGRKRRRAYTCHQPTLTETHSRTCRTRSSHRRHRWCKAGTRSCRREVGRNRRTDRTARFAIPALSRSPNSKQASLLCRKTHMCRWCRFLNRTGTSGVHRDSERHRSSGLEDSRAFRLASRMRYIDVSHDRRRRNGTSLLAAARPNLDPRVNKRRLGHSPPSSAEPACPDHRNMVVRCPHRAECTSLRWLHRTPNRRCKTQYCWDSSSNPAGCSTSS